ncbi:MAG: hypothetical protein ABIL25_05960 [candidate division WOR-3 bacterium]
MLFPGLFPGRLGELFRCQFSGFCVGTIQEGGSRVQLDAPGTFLAGWQGSMGQKC